MIQRERTKVWTAVLAVPLVVLPLVSFVSETAMASGGNRDHSNSGSQTRSPHGPRPTTPEREEPPPYSDDLRPQGMHPSHHSSLPLPPLPPSEPHPDNLPDMWNVVNREMWIRPENNLAHGLGEYQFDDVFGKRAEGKRFAVLVKAWGDV
jgi:hypothetical protein